MPCRFNIGIPVLLLVFVAGFARAQSNVDYIDPMFGAITDVPRDWGDAAGKTFPGADTPFGLVQLSPDTITGGDRGSGYSADDKTIEGFSFLHMLGVGCYGDLGNLQVMPETGPLIIDRTTAKSAYQQKNQVATAGYYSVVLDRYQVKTELTAAPHAGFIRFTFPASVSSYIKFDLARRIGKLADSHSTAQFIHQLDAYTVEGWIYCDPSSGGYGCFQRVSHYTVYFYMKFHDPIKSFGIWDGQDVSRSLTELNGKNSGFFIEFPTTQGQQVLVKAGISFVSMDGARANLLHDIPGWDFDAVHQQARALWASAISRIDVEGGSDADRRIFYSSLYQSMIDPRNIVDVNGYYASSDGKPHKANGFIVRSIFSGWDVYRAEFPLQNLINRSMVNDEINTLMQLTQQGDVKGLARWELLGIDTGEMVGDPAISIIANAYLQGIRGYDVQKAYQLCRAVALGPADQSNRVDFNDWIKHGYCMGKLSISATLDNSYDDYCLAQFAQALGKTDDAAQLYKSAQNYRNIFDSNIQWFHGRTVDGNLIPWQGFTTFGQGCIESTPGQEGWYVPQDVQGLINLLGGRDKFVARLNEMFEKTTPAMMVQWNNYYNISNENVEQCAFMFTYAGAPWLTQKWSRYTCSTAYKTGPYGLPGNDDEGELSAWYVLAASGFYPVCPCSNVYILGSPVFSRVTFHLDSAYAGGGKTFSIVAKNNSPVNIYIQSAQLDGTPLKRAWITYQEISNGGTLVLQMGPTPNKTWGSDPQDAPLSLSMPLQKLN
ncbi:MAG TPA: GH92 family glycosyl hydrolase [Phycisphaerae bacterium]|nr:GH92 family glycosyl hydrolase [Phycisphaerae bacterium]